MTDDRRERPPAAHPDSRPLRHAGDGWVECRCGAQHWGLFGAAGLLVSDGGRAHPAVILQHRALWSHHGGTWGVPGGALGPTESPSEGALREAAEEAGVPEDGVRAWAATALVHPDWSYTTIVGEAATPFTPAPTDAESLELAWVEVGDVPARELLPAFEKAWPHLRTLVGRRVLVVVDGANVIGARPDGWWKDRPGAAERLHRALDLVLPRGYPAATLGLAADRWWPDVTLVLEGAARSADVHGPPATTPGRAPVLAVRRAAGSGDDAILDTAEDGLRRGYTDVVVVTADRELASRVRAVGACVVSPSSLLAALA